MPMEFDMRVLFKAKGLHSSLPLSGRRPSAHHGVPSVENSEHVHNHVVN